ncbi:retrotransposon protein [Hordeum vulgare]|nr:retrotransposon protein [Hordeum vulgare]
MATRYAALGSTLEDSALVKRLLDSVPDRLYAVVAGIEQFCDVSTMLFEDALGRLKAFDERLQRRGQTGGEREDGQLMLTAEQWRATERQRSAVAVQRQEEPSWSLLPLRRVGTLQEGLPALEEGASGGGTCVARRRRRRERRPALSRVLGRDCWDISRGEVSNEPGACMGTCRAR